MPRKDMTLANKIAVLNQIKGQPPNTSHRLLAEITGVPKSTVARLIQQQDKLREEWTSSEGQQRATRKRKREGKVPDVEEALNQWYSVVVELGVCVSGPMLKSKSEELAKNLGHENFKASDGWLSRWKSRHDIKFKRVHGENSCAEQWLSKKLPSLMKKFSPDDIYNVVETGLIYRAMPAASLSYAYETLSSSKKAMDHVTVLCCSSMSGTDKRKLLVVGKISRPPCFNGLKMDSLPVLYYANKKAWMTSEIFTKWLLSWDLELQWTSREILLLLDDCAVHPHLDCLRNIHMEFLPPKTASVVQPMDMGIVNHLKMLYRDRLVNYLLESVEDNLLTPTSSAKEAGAKISLLLAVQFLADSWREISSETIRNCFCLSGFRHPDLVVPSVINSKNETTWQLHHVRNYEEYVCIDNATQCYVEKDGEVDTIVGQITAKQQTTSSDEESDEDDKSELDQLTIQDARRFVSGLRLYFMQHGNEGSPLSALDLCADFVHFQSIKRTRPMCHKQLDFNCLK